MSHKPVHPYGASAPSIPVTRPSRLDDPVSIIIQGRRAQATPTGQDHGPKIAPFGFKALFYALLLYCGIARFSGLIIDRIFKINLGIIAVRG